VSDDGPRRASLQVLRFLAVSDLLSLFHQFGASGVEPPDALDDLGRGAFPVGFVFDAERTFKFLALMAAVSLRERLMVEDGLNLPSALSV
jgi:hypothetical protein